jgi:hypothetical protein
LLGGGASMAEFLGDVQQLPMHAIAEAFGLPKPKNPMTEFRKSIGGSVTDKVREGIDSATGDYTKSDKSGLDAGSRFLGEMAGSGFAPTNARQLATLLTSSGGYGVGKEVAPDSTVIPIIASIVGGMGSEGVAGGIKGLMNPKSNKPLVEAAKRQGVNLTPAQKSGSKMLKGVEDVSANGPFRPESLDNALEGVSSSFSSAYNRLLDRIFPIADEDAARQLNTANWDKLKAAAGNKSPVEMGGTLKAINETLDDLGKSMSPRPEEKAVIRELEDLKAQIEKSSPKAEAIAATRKSFNQDFESNRGGIKGLLNKVNHAMKEDLSKFGDQKDPQFGALYKEANETTQNLNRRRELEDWFNTKVFPAGRDDVNYRQFLREFDPMGKNRDTLKRLLPDSERANIEDLMTIARELKQFKGAGAIDYGISALSGLGSIGFALATGNIPMALAIASPSLGKALIKRGIVNENAVNVLNRGMSGVRGGVRSAGKEAVSPRSVGRVVEGSNQ